MAPSVAGRAVGVAEEGAVAVAVAVEPRGGDRGETAGAGGVDGGDETAVWALISTSPGTAAILERPSLGADEAARAADGAVGEVVAGRIVELAPRRVVAEIDAPAEGVVVLHEAWFPGWEARVDGSTGAPVPGEPKLSKSRALVMARTVTRVAGRPRCTLTDLLHGERANREVAGAHGAERGLCLVSGWRPLRRNSR